MSLVPRTHAATIHVTSSNGIGDLDFEDNGNCSLIEAIRSANNNAAEDACEAGDPVGTAVDTIVLPPNAVFSSAEPFFVSNRLLPNVGDGQIIEGNGSVLERAPGATKKFGILALLQGDLTLRNLTLRNGDATDDSGGSVPDGGAVANLSVGTLTLENVRLTGNRARNGGAVYDRFRGKPTFRDSLFLGNVATNYGGAIAQPRHAGVQYGSGAVIVGSVFENNEAATTGGALWIEQPSAEIADSTFTGNSAQLGGAIALDFNYSISIVNSTVSGNKATFSTGGGGLYGGISGDVRIRNSTFSGNSGIDDGRGYQIGLFGRGSIWIDSSTILNASFPADDFAEAIQISAQAYRIYSSVIGGCRLEADGPLASVLENNWFIYDNCDGTADGNPQLGPLQNNGGPTLTHEPLEGSPLIDSGAVPEFGIIGSGGALGDYVGDIDQRGLPRPADAYDIGSVEIQPKTGFDALSPGQQGAIILLLQRRSDEDQ